MIIRDIPEAYATTVGAINTRIRQNPDGPPGDPVRAAGILVRVARRRDIPYHLPLGVIAAERIDPARRAAPGAGPQVARGQPVRRLRRAVPGRVPARHAGLTSGVPSPHRRGFRPALRVADVPTNQRLRSSWWAQP